MLNYPSNHFLPLIWVRVSGAPQLFPSPALAGAFLSHLRHTISLVCPVSALGVSCQLDMPQKAPPRWHSRPSGLEE